MRIISKFNDYYDCIQSYGFDDSSMYKRKTEKYIIDAYDYPKLKSFLRMKRGYEIHSGIHLSADFLLYCGKLYPYLRITHSVPDEYDHMEKVYDYAYSMEQLYNFFGKLDDKVRVKVEENFESKRTKRWEYYHGKHFNTKAVEEFFTLTDTYDCNQILIDKHVPIARFSTKSTKLREWSNPSKFNVDLIVNPNLSDLKFFKVKSHFEAFTDIRNYITQQLGGNSPQIVTVSNTSKIVKAGFDLKSSFRKAPTTKR